MKLYFTDFSPDLDPVAAGIMGQKIPASVRMPLTDANWVYSTPAPGWANMPMPTVQGGNNALPGKCLGAFSVLVGTTPMVVLATANQLYIYNSGSYFSQNLTLKNLSNHWYFTLYGNDLIAVNGIDPAQVSTNGGSFSALGGTPPVFSIIEATDFSLWGVVPNSSQLYFTLNDTLWTPNISTQTGTITLTSTPGAITAARTLRGGLNVYKRYSFYNGQFTGGPPFFWQFTKVSDRIGTPGPRSIIMTDTVHYFWGPDDFYATDGFTMWRVQNNVRRWFQANLDPTYDAQIYGVYDLPRSQLVWWFASVNANPPGSYDSYVSLNLLTGAWSKGNYAIDTPVQGQVGEDQAWTWGRFENHYGYYRNIPAGTLYDDNPPTGGSKTLYAAFIDRNHRMNLLNGPWSATIPAFITTGDLGDKVNMYRITRARGGWKSLPGVGAMAGTTNCTVYGTYNQGQPIMVHRGPVPVSSYGFYDFVSSDRLQRLKIGWYADGELADLDVNLAFSGTQ